MSRMPIIVHENTYGYGLQMGSLKFTQIPTHRTILMGTYWWVLTGFLGINIRHPPI